MLHPKKNRIDYGEQLIPPPGYELTYAVGTSYSLDLEALMLLPVALFYSQQLDGNPDEIRYDMLDAITNSASKITIFYQKGQLKSPHKYHYLMAYWEKGIEPITMPDHISSFHPKVWVIRYESKDDLPRYRVLVTSRNLTFARDWDVAFATDGMITDQVQAKNSPLIHFLQYLNATSKKKLPTSFISDLLKIKFDTPENFESFSFLPIGIQNPATNQPYSNFLTNTKLKWDEMLVVSPFVDKTTLNKLYKAVNSTPYLLSRKDELDAVVEETLRRFNCWQFFSFFQEAEFLEESEEEDLKATSQNLHAKLYITLLNKTSYWYLGSANCSDPAQNRNVEFMVELKGSKVATLTPKQVFKSMTDPAKSEGVTLFTPYDLKTRKLSEEQQKINLKIRKIKYDLTLMPINGQAILIENASAYNLSIEIDASNCNFTNDFQVRIKPISEQQKVGILLEPGKLNIIKNFGGYAETALSIFLELEIINDGIIHSHFLLPMEIDLPESRLNKIFTSIINSRDKFIKYLTFLLTGEETDLINNIKSHKKAKLIDGVESSAFSGTPLYEKILIAASRYPEKLKSIDILIQRLKDESSDHAEPIISPAFESFWQTFQSFMKIKQ